SRRARSEEEKPPHLLHLMFAHGDERSGPREDGGGDSFGPVSCETDRSRFIGRGYTLASPQAMQHSGPLSNTDGSVLDPVVSLRRAVAIEPGQTVTVCLALGMAEDRRSAEALAGKYQNARIGERAFELAWTHGQVTLHQLSASESEARLYGKLAGSLIYAKSVFRAPP